MPQMKKQIASLLLAGSMMGSTIDVGGSRKTKRQSQSTLPGKQLSKRNKRNKMQKQSRKKNRS